MKIKPYIEFINENKDYSTRDQVASWLDALLIENYTINEDLSVDVTGEVNISNRDVKKIPIKFNTVRGYFWCTYNKLTSLKNSPQSVGGDFGCFQNKITSLKHCPQIIGGIFRCERNKLTSLLGLPINYDLNILDCGNDILKWNWLESILSDDESLISYNIKWIIKNKERMPKTFEDKYGYLIEFEHYTKTLKN